jgi:hypothetical protein
LFCSEQESLQRNGDFVVHTMILVQVSLQLFFEKITLMIGRIV